MKDNLTAFVLVLWLTQSAHAQLRIISLNASNSATVTSGPRAGMDTILAAIYGQR